MEKVAKIKYKIVVVEDDEVMLGAICDELKDAGFEVMRAHDGIEGLDIVLSQKPDLILLDIIMPKMDGMTMLGKLRKSDNNYGEKVPVILLTNLNPDDKIMRGVTMDEPSYYLVKSQWTLDNVVEKVKGALETSPLRQ